MLKSGVTRRRGISRGFEKGVRLFYSTTMWVLSPIHSSDSAYNSYNTSHDQWYTAV